MRVTHEQRTISDYVARLQKVSSYARSLGISAVEVYRRIDAEKIEGVKIDGVAFVVLPKKGASEGFTLLERDTE